VLADRPVLDKADLEEFARSIPLCAAHQVGAAVGPAHASARGDPRVAVAVRARGGPILAVEFNLSPLLPLVSESRPGPRAMTAVVDRSGRVVLASGEPRAHSCALLWWKQRWREIPAPSPAQAPTAWSAWEPPPKSPTWAGSSPSTSRPTMLSPVHRVCEAHHGRVTVESEPGKGSTFTVVLPIQQERALV
jgi:hypothetical protein